MPRLQILSKEEIAKFNSPPKLNDFERKKYFAIDSKIDSIIERIDSPTNKVGLVLLYGYFKISGKFFTTDNFNYDDVKYVGDSLGIKNNEIDFDRYMEKGFRRHKKLICELLNYHLFTELDRNIVFSEIDSLIEIQTRPRQIFSIFVNFLTYKKVELPNYYTIANLITDRFNSYEKKVLTKLEELLDDDKKKLLDDLIKIPESDKNDKEEGNTEVNLTRYKLTLLKKPSHSTRPGKIKESIDDFVVIKNLYQKIKPIIDELNLPIKAVRYYALWATKANVTKLIQFSSPYKRYLYLISFITHQYYFRQDLFVDMVLASVQSAKNAVKKLEKEEYFSSKKDRDKALKAISKSHSSFKETFEKVKRVIESEYLTNDEKVQKSIELFEDFKMQKADIELPIDITDLIEIETSPKSKDEKYYDLLETRSIKLQNRLNQIIKCLEFNEKTSDKHLIEAINNYKIKEGNIDKKAPFEFLSFDEQTAVYSYEEGKFRISLYKALLFTNIASSLKSGNLSLKHSYRYLSIEEYLIDLEIWKKNKYELLKKAGLEEFVDFENVISFLKKALDKQYSITNRNILNKKNKYISFNKDDKPIISTPKVEKEETGLIANLFPENEFYPILDILSDVNRVTNFTNYFEHYNVKYAKQKPSDEIFYAGIMGKGFDIGTNRIAKISKGININTLENTINWHFTLDNIYTANNLLAEHINKLSLPNLFLTDQNKLHTASDGQKFEVATDSMNANYSFKYGGNQKALSVYSFNDEKGRLFYNTAFSSSEREAPFVIDGLNHNDEIRSDIHSTDTHGFTETIFAATHMLGIFFAPRIKNLKKQKLYAFKYDKLPKIKSYKKKGYKILPSEYIDEDLIKENWDNILRLIVTIKLKHTTASQIFKRLSSYAKQNPLYKALKEFGRITKTIFILKYYDELELRQAIEKQLNLVELSHKFAKAIFFGSNQEFQVESKEEQEIIVNCRRLIQNAIILWNYLFLTKLLLEQKSKEKQQEILKIIKNGSIIFWQHVNLYGEYDFTRTSITNTNFDLEELVRFQVGKH